MSEDFPQPDEDCRSLFELGLKSASQSGSHVWQPPTVDNLQRSLPQYEISAFIARGGMGAVYKGMQKSLLRVVAIKVLPPDAKEGDLQFALRFKHEARAMAQLSHPNIVAVHDAGETADGLLYFVMEFIEGTDLAQILASEGKIEPNRALGIITEVCDALSFAHESGIIHRDIKPSNIMLDKRGQVKVADFGLAKTVNLEATQVTGTDLAMGSPNFIAPEVMIPGIKVDQRADVYSVGIMLYQMLTGKIPRGRFEHLSRVVPGLDKRLDAIVDRTLQNEREARYANATELRAALDPITRSLARRTTTIAKEKTPVKTQSGKRPLLLAFAVVAVLLVAVGAFFLKKPQPKSEAGAGRPGADATTGPLHTWEHNVFAAMDRTDATQGMTRAEMQGPLLHIRGNEGWLTPGRNVRDVAVRTMLVWAKGTQNLKIVTRVWTGPGARHGHYFARLWSNNIELGLYQDGADRNIKTLPIIRTWKDGDEVALQFASIGSLHTVWLNGQMIGSITDSTVMESGTAGIQAGDALFKSLDDLPLDGLPEAEELKLVGISSAAGSSPPVPQASDSLPPLPASIEVRAVKLWDKPEMMWGSMKGVSWEKEAMRLDKHGMGPLKVSIGDIILRASILANRDSVATRLRIRNPSGVTAPGTSAYELSVDAKAGMVILALRNKGIYRELGRWKLPRSYDPDDWIKMEWRAVGDVFTVAVDGRMLGTVRDGTLSQPGGLGIYSDSKGYFRDISYITLDDLPEAETLKLVPLEPKRKRQWRKVDLAGLAQAEVAQAAKNSEVRSGRLRLTHNDAWFSPSPFVNGALRTSVHWTDKTNLPQVLIRKTAAAPRYYLRALPDGSAEVGIKQLDEIVLARYPGGTARKEGDEVQLQLACIGHQITAWMDGRLLGSLEDGTVSDEGSAGIQAQDAEFTTLESIKLDGMSDAEALKLANLDAAGKEMPSAAADAPALPANGWRPFITDLAAIKTRTGVTLLPDGWLRLEEAYLEGPHLRNVALRARLRFQQNTAWALKIRENKTTHEAYTVAVSSDGSAVTLRRMGVGAKGGSILAKVPLPSRIAAGQEYELTLAASGDVLTVYLDGKPIIYQLDTICKEEGVTLGASAMSEVNDAQWLSLGGTTTSAAP